MRDLIDPTRHEGGPSFGVDDAVAAQAQPHELGTLPPHVDDAPGIPLPTDASSWAAKLRSLEGSRQLLLSVRGNHPGEEKRTTIALTRIESEMQEIRNKRHLTADPADRNEVGEMSAELFDLEVGGHGHDVDIVDAWIKLASGQKPVPALHEIEHELRTLQENMRRDPHDVFRTNGPVDVAAWAVHDIVNSESGQQIRPEDAWAVVGYLNRLQAELARLDSTVTATRGDIDVMLSREPLNVHVASARPGRPASKIPGLSEKSLSIVRTYTGSHLSAGLRPNRERDAAALRWLTANSHGRFDQRPAALDALHSVVDRWANPKTGDTLPPEQQLRRIAEEIDLVTSTSAARHLDRKGGPALKKWADTMIRRLDTAERLIHTRTGGDIRRSSSAAVTDQSVVHTPKPIKWAAADSAAVTAPRGNPERLVDLRQHDVVERLAGVVANHLTSSHAPDPMAIREFINSARDHLETPVVDEDRLVQHVFQQSMTASRVRINGGKVSSKFARSDLVFDDVRNQLRQDQWNDRVTDDDIKIAADHVLAGANQPKNLERFVRYVSDVVMSGEITAMRGGSGAGGRGSGRTPQHPAASSSRLPGVSRGVQRSGAEDLTFGAQNYMFKRAQQAHEEALGVIDRILEAFESETRTQAVEYAIHIHIRMWRRSIRGLNTADAWQHHVTFRRNLGNFNAGNQSRDLLPGLEQKFDDYMGLVIRVRHVFDQGQQLKLSRVAEIQFNQNMGHFGEVRDNPEDNHVVPQWFKLSEDGIWGFRDPKADELVEALQQWQDNGRRNVNDLDRNILDLRNAIEAVHEYRSNRPSESIATRHEDADALQVFLERQLNEATRLSTIAERIRTQIKNAAEGGAPQKFTIPTGLLERSVAILRANRRAALDEVRLRGSSPGLEKWQTDSSSVFARGRSKKIEVIDNAVNELKKEKSIGLDAAAGKLTDIYNAVQEWRISREWSKSTRDAAVDNLLKEVENRSRWIATIRNTAVVPARRPNMLAEQPHGRQATQAGTAPQTAGVQPPLPTVEHILSNSASPGLDPEVIRAHEFLQERGAESMWWAKAIRLAPLEQPAVQMLVAADLARGGDGRAVTNLYRRHPVLLTDQPLAENLRNINYVAIVDAVRTRVEPHYQPGNPEIDVAIGAALGYLPRPRTLNGLIDYVVQHIVKGQRIGDRGLGMIVDGQGSLR